VRALGVLGESLLHAGGAERTAHAVEALQRARALADRMELADPDTVRRLADLAEASALLGEHDAADAALAEADAKVTGWGEPAWGAGAAAAVGRARAVALAARGDSAAGVAVLREAVEGLRALPLPLELARALVVWGAIERRARHRATARDALTEAERLCLRHGAAPLLTRARAELDRLTPGERPRGRDTLELTASEQRIARLVADGATNREAAAALFVSVKTVEGTLSRVYRKLGVRSRTALARAVVDGH
jgi:DNA-binding NarL/FixJ family response regulator